MGLIPLLIGGGIAPIDPASLNPSWYLKANTNLTFNAGVNATEWIEDIADIMKSSNPGEGNIISQVNSLNILDFNINNCVFFHNANLANYSFLNASWTIIIVYNTVDLTNNNALVDITNSSTNLDHRIRLLENSTGVLANYKDGTNLIQIQTNDTSQDETYKFIALVYDNKELTLYSKGQIYTASQAVFTPVDFSTAFRPAIGSGTRTTAAASPSTQFLTGKFLEAVVFNFKLTQDQINGIAQFEANKFNYSAILF